MNVLRHWLEADEKPRCQYCPALADERSFMCEDHAGEADEEVQTLRDQLEGAVAENARMRAVMAEAVDEIQNRRVEDAIQMLLNALDAGGQ